MTRYIAFLRGINVGGHRLVSMETLRQLLVGMNLENVKTYIQSGNVLFDAPEVSLVHLEKDMESHLHQTLGYQVPVFIRTIPQMAAIVKHNPFVERLTEATAKMYVAFLEKAPDSQAKSSLLTCNNETEAFSFREREVYCLVYKKDQRNQRYAMDSLEKILGQPATIRNWNTVNKVLSM